MPVLVYVVCHLYCMNSVILCTLCQHIVRVYDCHVELNLLLTYLQLVFLVYVAYVTISYMLPLSVVRSRIVTQIPSVYNASYCG